MVTEGWGPREGSGGAFQERNKVPTGLGVELEVLAEIQVRHKQTTRKDLVSWRLSSGNFTFLSQASLWWELPGTCLCVAEWLATHLWLAEDDSGHLDPRKSGPAHCDGHRWH